MVGIGDAVFRLDEPEPEIVPPGMAEMIAGARRKAANT
jgi:hypothetical protein